MDTIINRYQTDFLGNCFIAKNGMIPNIITEQAHVQKRPEIGLLLDQEKAYDRVHPIVNQRRDLQQGGPLSPLLFNIALEPFLRHILQDSSFQGFQFQFVSNSATTTSNIMPPPLKVLAYADDVCVLLNSTDNYCRLLHHLDRYGPVSNAKINIHKTGAFSLDGHSYSEWIAFLAAQDTLEDNLPQSCSQLILLDHIRRFHSGNTGTRLALFFPLLRLRPAAHANNFMQNIYEAVDSFGYADTKQAKCTPATLLRLPLSAIFAMIPADYWITQSRHKKLKVPQFLRMITTLDIYDLYCHLTSLSPFIWFPS
ncbi:hypothetical protein G6F22_005668 [Rhizopus arrhizus]|nr:hypothetical protein G6F22_005668 [Rhizopus arrhizus]KAG1103275.1 hypothetical protein G6F40_011236 [Rhizopus arrhizus]